MKNDCEGFPWLGGLAKGGKESCLYVVGLSDTARLGIIVLVGKKENEG